MGVAEAIAYARAQLGKPYVFGAAGPNAYDCSGLVEKATEAGGGPTTPHSTYLMIAMGSPVSQSSLAPGDWVFPDAGHVQLYVGGGMVIESPHTGAFVREVKMWGFWQGRRVWRSDQQNYTGGNTTVLTGVDTTPVLNPLDPSSVAQAILDRLPVIGELDKLGKVLTNTGFWKRAGVFMLGVLIILIAIAWMRRSQIEQAGALAAKAAVLA